MITAKNEKTGVEEMNDEKTNVEDVLDYVESNGPMRYTDILRFFVEVVRGCKYDRNARGMISHQMSTGLGFFPEGYFLHIAPRVGRFRCLEKRSDGLYEVRKYNYR